MSERWGEAEGERKEEEKKMMEGHIGTSYLGEEIEGERVKREGGGKTKNKEECGSFPVFHN